MKLKNTKIIIFCIIGFAFGGVVLAQEISDAQIQQGIQHAQAMQATIEAECKSNPYTCSCDAIPCNEILNAKHPRAKEGYDRCIQEKNKCQSMRQSAIKQIEDSKQNIETQCRKDLSSCDCSSVNNSDGKKECELKIIEVKYQAEKEKQDKIKICSEDLDACDCSSISDSAGRVECEKKSQEAKKLKEKIKSACEEDLINCDCSEIENQTGRAECEKAKTQGLEETDGKIKDALSKCFKNVDTCDCSSLNIPEESYVSFCEIQKGYGLSCKREGINCDKLEDIEIYPAGMPSWLGTIFAKSYSSYIEKEKAKGAKEAAGIIEQCLNDAKNCQCEKTPTYARAFCEKNKALQIKCEAGDYDACLILDETPNLPEGIPSFSYNILDRLVGSLRDARKNLIISNAARKVGNMILECMDDASKCDCSLAPSGPIKSFCLHKQTLVGLCRDKKQYESCFQLDEEPNYPTETPDIIKNYIQKSILPKIEAKKQIIFNQMKKGTVCDNIATLSECKKIYYNK